MKVRLRYLHEDRDRHGNVRLYVQRKGGRKVRIRETPGTDAFLVAYRLALIEREQDAPEKREKVKLPTKGTFRWLCAAYLDSAETRQLENSTRKVRRGILEHCWDEPISHKSTDRFGDVPLSAFTAKAVRVLRDRKAEAPESANGRVKAIRQVFKWAMQPGIELVLANPARDVPYLKPGKVGGFHAWTIPEVNQYRERHGIGTKARLALELLLLTTQRRADVVHFGPQHVRDGWLHFTQHKGRNRKPVTLSLPIHADLRAAIDATPTGHMAFLVTAFGKPFTSNGFGNWFKKRCTEAGLPHCSAHGLRKAGTAVLAEQGATDREIMAVTGHVTSKEVDRYTRSARQKKLAEAAIRRSEGGTE